MAEVRASIPVLRFCAGSLFVGLAAEDVVAVSTDTSDEDIHIATRR